MTQKLPFELCFQAIYVHNTPFMRPFTILIATALTFNQPSGPFRTIRRFSFKDFQFITGVIYDSYLSKPSVAVAATQTQKGLTCNQYIRTFAFCTARLARKKA
jgi:hypothetical protein